MKNIIFIITLLLLTGCFPKTEYGPVITEEAVITEVIYTPSQHGTGTGVGMSMKGTMVVSTTSIDVPEVFAVVFMCPHGKFIIKRKEVWQKAAPGMKVIVTYRNVYRVTDKTKSLADYDFIDFQEIK